MAELEDLEDSLIFQSLVAHYPGIFHELARNGWFLCLPPASSLGDLAEAYRSIRNAQAAGTPTKTGSGSTTETKNSSSLRGVNTPSTSSSSTNAVSGAAASPHRPIRVSKHLIETHVLQPSKTSPGEYLTLNGRSVLIKGNEIKTQNGFAQKRTVKITYSEDFDYIPDAETQEASPFNSRDLPIYLVECPPTHERQEAEIWGYKPHAPGSSRGSFQEGDPSLDLEFSGNRYQLSSPNNAYSPSSINRGGNLLQQYQHQPTTRFSVLHIDRPFEGGATVPVIAEEMDRIKVRQYITTLRAFIEHEALFDEIDDFIKRARRVIKENGLNSLDPPLEVHVGKVIDMAVKMLIKAEPFRRQLEKEREVYEAKMQYRKEQRRQQRARNERLREDMIHRASFSSRNTNHRNSLTEDGGSGYKEEDEEREGDLEEEEEEEDLRRNEGERQGSSRRSPAALNATGSNLKTAATQLQNASHAYERKSKDYRRNKKLAISSRDDDSRGGSRGSKGSRSSRGSNDERRRKSSGSSGGGVLGLLKTAFGFQVDYEEENKNESGSTNRKNGSRYSYRNTSSSSKKSKHKANDRRRRRSRSKSRRKKKTSSSSMGSGSTSRSSPRSSLRTGGTTANGGVGFSRRSHHRLNHLQKFRNKQKQLLAQVIESYVMEQLYPVVFEGLKQEKLFLQCRLNYVLSSMWQVTQATLGMRPEFQCPLGPAIQELSLLDKGCATPLEKLLCIKDTFKLIQRAVEANLSIQHLNIGTYQMTTDDLLDQIIFVMIQVHKKRPSPAIPFIYTEPKYFHRSNINKVNPSCNTKSISSKQNIAHSNRHHSPSNPVPISQSKGKQPLNPGNIEPFDNATSEEIQKSSNNLTNQAHLTQQNLNLNRQSRTESDLIWESSVSSVASSRVSFSQNTLSTNAVNVNAIAVQGNLTGTDGLNLNTASSSHSSSRNTTTSHNKSSSKHRSLMCVTPPPSDHPSNVFQGLERLAEQQEMEARKLNSESTIHSNIVNSHSSKTTTKGLSKVGRREHRSLDNDTNATNSKIQERNQNISSPEGSLASSSSHQPSKHLNYTLTTKRQQEHDRRRRAWERHLLARTRRNGSCACHWLANIAYIQRFWYQRNNFSLSAFYLANLEVAILWLLDEVFPKRHLNFLPPPPSHISLRIRRPLKVLANARARQRERASKRMVIHDSNKLKFGSNGKTGKDQQGEKKNSVRGGGATMKEAVNRLQLKGENTVVVHGGNEQKGNSGSSSNIDYLSSRSETERRRINPNREEGDMNDEKKHVVPSGALRLRVRDFDDCSMYYQRVSHGFVVVFGTQATNAQHMWKEMARVSKDTKDNGLDQQEAKGTTTKVSSNKEIPTSLFHSSLFSEKYITREAVDITPEISVTNVGHTRSESADAHLGSSQRSNPPSSLAPKNASPDLSTSALSIASSFDAADSFHDCHEDEDEYATEDEHIHGGRDNSAHGSTHGSAHGSIHGSASLSSSSPSPSGTTRTIYRRQLDIEKMKSQVISLVSCGAQGLTVATHGSPADPTTHSLLIWSAPSMLRTCFEKKEDKYFKEHYVNPLIHGSYRLASHHDEDFDELDGIPQFVIDPDEDEDDDDIMLDHERDGTGKDGVVVTNNQNVRRTRALYASPVTHSLPIPGNSPVRSLSVGAVFALALLDDSKGSVLAWGQTPSPLASHRKRVQAANYSARKQQLQKQNQQRRRYSNSSVLGSPRSGGEAMKKAAAAGSVPPATPPRTYSTMPSTVYQTKTPNPNLFPKPPVEIDVDNTKIGNERETVTETTASMQKKQSSDESEDKANDLASSTTATVQNPQSTASAASSQNTLPTYDQYRSSTSAPSGFSSVVYRVHFPKSVRLYRDPVARELERIKDVRTGLGGREVVMKQASINDPEWVKRVIARNERRSLGFIRRVGGKGADGLMNALTLRAGMAIETNDVIMMRDHTSGHHEMLSSSTAGMGELRHHSGTALHHRSGNAAAESSPFSMANAKTNHRRSPSLSHRNESSSVDWLLESDEELGFEESLDDSMESWLSKHHRGGELRQNGGRGENGQTMQNMMISENVRNSSVSLASSPAHLGSSSSSSLSNSPWSLSREHQKQQRLLSAEKARRLNRSTKYPVFCEFPVGKITLIACGGAHCLAATSTGLVFSWGKGKNGRLGNGTEEDIFSPTLVTPPLVISRYERNQKSKSNSSSSSSSSSSHAKEKRCRQGTLRGWDGSIRQLSCGWSHSLVLTSRGSCFAFGCGSDGRLGVGSHADHRRPELIRFGPNIVPKIKGKGVTSNATTNGNNDAKKIDPTKGDNISAYGLDGQQRRVRIGWCSAGHAHSAFVSSSGSTLYTTGSGRFGQLGNDSLHCRVHRSQKKRNKGMKMQRSSNANGGSGLSKRKPRNATGVNTSSSSSSKSKEPRALKWTTTVPLVCPLPLTNKRPSSRNSRTKDPILQVECGNFHTCVLTASGEVYTWGLNANGQCGHAPVPELYLITSPRRLELENISLVVSSDQDEKIDTDNFNNYHTTGKNQPQAVKPVAIAAGAVTTAIVLNVANDM
eukprot:g1295.t1